MSLKLWAAAGTATAAVDSVAETAVAGASGLDANAVANEGSTAAAAVAAGAGAETVVSNGLFTATPVAAAAGATTGDRAVCVVTVALAGAPK